MRDRQLSEDYDSLIFEYCDEYPDVAIKQLVKLIEKTEFRVAFNKKKQIRSPQKKTEMKMIESFKTWKLIAEKQESTRAKIFMVYYSTL